jgi:hypothetical protein
MLKHVPQTGKQAPTILIFSYMCLAVNFLERDTLGTKVLLYAGTLHM